MITKLTAEQEARFPEFVERWTDIGLSTQPANRFRAEQAIRQLYANEKLPPPKIVWCDSPFAQVITDVLSKNIMANVFANVDANLGNKVGANVWVSVTDNIHDEVRANVRANTSANVFDNILAHLSIQVHKSISPNIYAKIRADIFNNTNISAKIYANVNKNISDGINAGANTSDNVWNTVFANLITRVRDNVWRNINYNVRAKVPSRTGADIGTYMRHRLFVDNTKKIKCNEFFRKNHHTITRSIYKSRYGQHDAFWLSSYAFVREVLGLTRETEPLVPCFEQAQSAGWYITYKNICWMSERPNVLKRDDRGRLHCVTGPALSYPDGWSIYAVHGLWVPEKIIEQKDKITTKDIDTETNQEIRRILLDFYGMERYFRQSSPKLVSRDSFGELYRKTYPDQDVVQFVKVRNSTPEPDGSQKFYFLFTDREVKTAHEAVARSFGMRPEEYQPTFES